MTSIIAQTWPNAHVHTKTVRQMKIAIITTKEFSELAWFNWSPPKVKRHLQITENSHLINSLWYFGRVIIASRTNSQFSNETLINYIFEEKKKSKIKWIKNGFSAFNLMKNVEKKRAEVRDTIWNSKSFVVVSFVHQNPKTLNG